MRILLLLMFLPCVVNAGIFGSSNYWECILEEMPGVRNDPAVYAVIGKCRKDFPNRSSVRKKSSIFGGTTARECFLEHGKAVSNPKTVKFLRHACYRLYPKE